MNKAVAKITNLGYNTNGNTVLYLLGETAAIAEAPFRVTIKEGNWSMYTSDLKDTLLGALVEVSYNGISDMRIPQDVKFVGIV